MLEIAPAPTPTDDVDLDRGIARAVDHLLSLQHPDGYWWGARRTSRWPPSTCCWSTSSASVTTAAGARSAPRLLERQLPDGSWPTYFGGPGDVSITTEAYFALKLAGADPSSLQMAGAREFVRSHGGIGATRIFTKLWLALFGQFEWNAFPAMPPEAIPAACALPLNVYAFASWARATIVPIRVVWAHRPAVPLPDGAGVSGALASIRAMVRVSGTSATRRR